MEPFVVNQKIAYLRRKNHLTQEKFASALGVSNQAVSKWESGVCCPDIQLLPLIAKIFDISIDSLFSTDDYELRSKLLTRYECTNEMEDFFPAINAYESVYSSGKATVRDLGDYALLLARYGMKYIRQAEKIYENALKLGSKQKTEHYYLIHTKIISLMCQQEKYEQCIGKYKLMLDKEPDNWWNHYLLSLAYLQANQAENAWKSLEQTLNTIDHNFYLSTLAGDISEKLGNYENAFSFWQKAYYENPKQISCLYSKAFLFEKLNQKTEAIEVWQTIIKWHHDNNQFHDHETDMPLKHIELLLA